MDTERRFRFCQTVVTVPHTVVRSVAALPNTVDSEEPRRTSERFHVPSDGHLPGLGGVSVGGGHGPHMKRRLGAPTRLLPPYSCVPSGCGRPLPQALSPVADLRWNILDTVMLQY
jgi:hypothetical protein